LGFIKCVKRMPTLQELENEILTVYKQILLERKEYQIIMRDVEYNLNRDKSENLFLKGAFIVIIYMYLYGIIQFNY
jgi:hypothetical protein